MEKIDFGLVLRFIKDAESPDLQTRTQAIEFCRVQNWSLHWHQILEFFYAYFNGTPADSQLVFWCLQVLEASTDLISRDPTTFRQFLSAILPQLSSENDANYVATPSFIRNMFAGFLARMFFLLPDILSEYFLALCYDLFLRVCLAFDETINASTPREKEMLKSVLDNIFNRFIGHFNSTLSSSICSPAAVTNTLGTLRVISCYIDWCDINLVIKNFSIFQMLFAREQFSVGVVEMFSELFRKGMLPPNKLLLIKEFQLPTFFLPLSSPVNFDLELLHSISRLLNVVGNELAMIHSDSALDASIHSQSLDLIMQIVIPYYIAIFKHPSSANDDLKYNKNTDDEISSEEDEDIDDDLTVEITDFSLDLVQIFSRKNNQEFVSNILEFHMKKLESRKGLLKHYKHILDLISANFPELVLGHISTSNLYLLVSLGEAKGKQYFIQSNGTEFTDAGLLVLRIMGSLIEKPLEKYGVELINKFHIVFNISSPVTLELFLQILHRLLTDIEKRPKHVFLYLTCLNKLMKTKAVDLVQNNQQLIGGLLNLLLKTSFEPKLETQEREILYEGYASVGMLISDHGFLGELVSQLSLLIKQNPRHESTFYAVGHVIKGLLAGKISHFEPFTLLYREIIMNINTFFPNGPPQLLIDGQIQETTEPFTDSLVFGLVKICQISGLCTLETFTLLYPVYSNDLIAMCQYLLYKFKIVNPDVLLYLVETSTKDWNIHNLILVYGYLNAIPLESLTCQNEIDYLAVHLLTNIANRSNQWKSTSTDSVDSQLNLLLKGIVQYYKKNQTKNSVEIIVKLLEISENCSHSDATFIALSNELFSLIKNQSSHLTNVISSDILQLVTTEKSEKDAKKAFRLYFKKQQS